MNKNMRFLLQLLGASALTAGTAVSAVACNNSDSKVDISNGVSMNEFRLAADTTKTYQDLNSSQLVLTAIANQINSAKNVNVQANTDFTVSNDQLTTDLQSVGQKVIFTVTAVGSQIKGSFSFTQTLSLTDISDVGVAVTDPHPQVSPTQTYAQLNSNSDLYKAVASAINTAVGKTVVGGTDFILVNDQNPEAMQVAGTSVVFTVLAQGNQITGSFQFTSIIGKEDISQVTMNDLQTAADATASYAALNTNSNVLNAVAAAINTATNANVTTQDFSLVNDQSSITNQAPGTAVTFTVTATGKQITGQFKFVDTLSKTNISTGIIVNNINLNADANSNYGALNTNSTIINAVVSAINSTKGTNIAASDITLTNNQTATASQVSHQTIIFNVTPKATSAITGTFSFALTLDKININTGITIADPLTPANLGATYSQLNSDPRVTAAVVNAINVAKNINISANDIAITNNQTSSSLQTVGQVVTFTVTAIRGVITGSFTFTDTLVRTNISSGVNIPDLQTQATTTATYASLNTNTAFLSTIVNAINAAKNTNITTSDITLTNDQTATANQVGGTKVTFTVTANTTSTQIAGSFTFVNTLSKINIATGITVSDLQTVVTDGTFASLNTNTTIVAAVVSAINSTKGTNITANDITLTNNQSTTAQMVAGPVIFTVTANPTSTIIFNNFTFVDTLQRVNISPLSLTTLNIRADGGLTWASANANPILLNAVVSAIKNARNVTVTPGIDFYLNNNATPTQYQYSGITVTFSVYPTSSATTPWITPSGLITSNFAFSVNFSA